MMAPFVLALAALLGPVQEKKAAASPFLEREVQVDGSASKYRVYVPPDRKEGEKLPVILFLHGAGEAGSDNRQQTETGIGPEILAHPDRIRAVVVLPQCDRRSFWQGAAEARALAALDASEKEFGTDPKRVYLTGLSMGGYATWAIAGKMPDRFAALAVVCGGIKPPWDRKPIEGDPYRAAAEKVKQIPSWIFHGAADRTVPVTESQKMAALLKEMGADTRYTEYPGVPHNCWEKAYSEADLWTWLFAQAKK